MVKRLVDANSFKERYCEENCGKRRCIDNMDKCSFILSLEEEPTAYDVEEVVQDLDDYLFALYCIENDSMWEKIVRKGGVKQP